uniref:Uncharacterized protein n=1 Tax=Plectus sambesii TaxID=2011161 RepID=A0A914VL80_9BILA
MFRLLFILAVLATFQSKAVLCRKLNTVKVNETVDNVRKPSWLVTRFGRSADVAEGRDVELQNDSSIIAVFTAISSTISKFTNHVREMIALFAALVLLIVLLIRFTSLLASLRIQCGQLVTTCKAGRCSTTTNTDETLLERVEMGTAAF